MKAWEKQFWVAHLNSFYADLSVNYKVSPSDVCDEMSYGDCTWEDAFWRAVKFKEALAEVIKKDQIKGNLYG